MNTALFRRLARRPAAFCAVWGSQPKGEPPLADFKLHTACVRVCVGLTALAGVRCGIGGQPVLEVGVVCANIDQRLFLVEADFRNFLALCQPCSHTSSFLPSVVQEWHFLGVFFRLLTWKKWRFSNRSTPDNVRQWQNSLTSYRDESGKPYSQTYLKCINNQLTAIFNYAVKYYGLKENPCHKAGSMGKKHADEMLFWTRQEFQTFIEVMKDRPASYTVFMTMYFTGIREGELLALTPSDIDFEKKTLTVNKSYQRLGREDIITTPKTPKSNRTLPIPDGLCTCLQEYMSHCYGLQKDDRLFPYTKSFLYHEMEYGCKASGVKRIRVHDIRHSHASLLVEMGFSPLLIAERLGHEKVQTTMDTYSHLYPNKQVEVARQLDGIMP